MLYCNKALYYRC